MMAAWYKEDGKVLRLRDIRQPHTCSVDSGFFGVSGSDSNAISPPNSFAAHVSPPLPDALRVMAKISQNLHAEMFLRAAARQKTGDPSADAALQFEQDFRVGIGLKDYDVVMTDASGLSRKRFGVAAIGKFLYCVGLRSSHAAATFRSVLPVAGEDGTLMDRMKKTPAAGNVWAKTGSLTHVDSLAGYATSTRGAHLVFSFIGNNNNLKTEGCHGCAGRADRRDGGTVGPAWRAPAHRVNAKIYLLQLLV